jgi:hypothetical protein
MSDVFSTRCLFFKECKLQALSTERRGRVVNTPSHSGVSSPSRETGYPD